jgi:EAL domain-containing protein (putative c-di-GMP-specific phosphodiesterase class I)
LLLEVPDSALVNGTDVIVATLRACKELGVGIAVDGFGGAHAALSCVRSLPADFLNIDRSLIAGLGAQAGDEAVVSAVVHLAHRLGWQVIAAGVETAVQAERSRELVCDAAQGFYVSEPMAGDEVVVRLQAADAPSPR